MSKKIKNRLADKIRMQKSRITCSGNFGNCFRTHFFCLIPHPHQTISQIFHPCIQRKQFCIACRYKIFIRIIIIPISICCGFVNADADMARADGSYPLIKQYWPVCLFVWIQNRRIKKILNKEQGMINNEVAFHKFI